LGFSAGVMIYVSFVEILQQGSSEPLVAFLRRAAAGHGRRSAGFFAGVIVIAVIDRLIPESINPHEAHNERAEVEAHETVPPGTGTLLQHKDQKRLLRMGLFTALGGGHP
jgi:zinc transporter, ZIP family